MKDLNSIRKYWHNAQDNGSLPEDYQSWKAHRKQEFLWNEKIIKSKYDELPPLKKIDILGLFSTALKSKMGRQSDEVEANWKKTIHAHGSVAKIKLVPTENTFTGLFKGASYGLLRLSVTGDPADRGFAPGLALKLLVDGHPSGNFSALVSLTGQGKNYNLFANELSNIVPVVKEVGPILINLIFSRVTKYPTKLYLEDLAEINQQGEKESKPYYPTQIFLVPNPKIQFPETPHDFRNDLATIPAGTFLFSIYGVDSEAMKQMNPTELRQQAQLIGFIETTSEFVSSFYGDSQLFFRHQRFRNR
ncbi:hypothetical protein [Calothrix sp. PCC 6303]|uniref:hypothetical protein n=1 Tax=Calothrix sp. PCC 6303 TaxID=1170562 RepID=UPI0002A04AFB|nr:hypothetical protein [Calothrix sp. PCC 6303]AFZ04551.1 hypothetical protein Cal6303_5678 [Calothrix sp. PCC 6303]